MNLKEAENIPRFYGLSYRKGNYWRVYPIPINLIVRWVIKIFIYLKNPEFSMESIIPKASRCSVKINSDSDFEKLKRVQNLKDLEISMTPVSVESMADSLKSGSPKES